MEQWKEPFRQATPIWLQNREMVKNLFAGFRVLVDVTDEKLVSSAYLAVTASCVYRVHVNGVFVGHGPAVAAHGYFRVDEWEISASLRPGKNTIAIEVAGYNVSSFYTLDQPSFVQAEVVVNGEVRAATGHAGFEGAELPERVREVQRYSFQRPFIEVYRLSDGCHDWRYSSEAPLPLEKTSVQPTKQLLPRRVKLPEFMVQAPVAVVSRGTFLSGVKPGHYWKERGLTQVGPFLGGFQEEELVLVASNELQEMVGETRKTIGELYTSVPIAIGQGEYTLLDLGLNRTGFLGFQLSSSAPSRLWIIFDEILIDGDVDFKRLDCVNTVVIDLEPGEYDFETFEPYTMKYVKLAVSQGSCSVTGVYLREYANDDVSHTEFATNNERVNLVFAAGLETFRQNALDNFLDCPSRERAGWLCDSFFTARVAYDVSGNTLVEDNFLENYLLPEQYPSLPDGMLPMCYPSDHYNGRYIPNWALWLVIQLEEYGTRGGSRKLLDRWKEKVEKLFHFFAAYENEDELLEKLDSWVFVEWSQANKLVQDVNYPTNMLYAEALKAAGRTFATVEWIAKGERIKDVIRKQSYNGTFFVDHAVRRDGELRVQPDVTEVCQYYAFFFDVASPNSYPELWQKLVNDFGPHRQKTGKFPQVYPANAFIGNYLRLELLSRAGHVHQLMEESVDYFGYMAQRTGTLWEDVGDHRSCNHGFASHIVHMFYRDVLGIHRIDRARKLICLRFNDVPLRHCQGQLPLDNDRAFQLRWNRTGREIRYSLRLPKDYSIQMEAADGITVVDETIELY